MITSAATILLALATAATQPVANELPRRESMFGAVDAEPKATLTMDAAIAARLGKPGTLAFFPASGATVRLPPTAGSSIVTLSRGTQIASTGKAKADGYQRGHWDVEFAGKFAQASAKGTLMVAVFDAGDPQAIANNEVTALWSFVVPPTKQLSVRVRLDDDAGFRPGRIYVFRAVQLIGKRERVLAAGTLRLE